MSSYRNEMERFLQLFEELKHVAETPQRLVTFYKEKHPDFVRTADTLYEFLYQTNFEKTYFFGKKLHASSPPGVIAAWDEYKADWEESIEEARYQPPVLPPDEAAEYERLFAEFGLDKMFQIERTEGSVAAQKQDLRCPLPYESEFDPTKHRGGDAIVAGLKFLQAYHAEHFVDADDDLGSTENMDRDSENANRCGVSFGAFRYLYRIIGLDLSEVFERWQSLPPIFMSAHVSNKHGNERGSLNNLLDDAIRAYVCGAPAAALVLCRSIIEMLLNKHCNLTEDELFDLEKDGSRKTRKDGRPKELSLLKRIEAAEKRHEIWRRYRLYPRLERINDLIHDYSRIAPLDRKDDQFLRNFLLDIKTLIENSPRPE